MGIYGVRGRAHSYNIDLTHDRGIHHIKFGQSLRYNIDWKNFPSPASFNFSYAGTANTFIDPTVASGDPYASALLGVVNDGGSATVTPSEIYTRQWAAYIQDDVKLTRRITLNLGLRWEYEAAPYEAQNQISRYLDLTSPIPEFQQTAPQIPGAMASIANINYQWNGAWMFADSSHRALYNAPKLDFLPRIGMAFRINDLTALRFGYARYSTPIQKASAGGTSSIYGFNQWTDMYTSINGTPQSVLGNPFPSSHPLLPVTGKSLGRYTNLGSGADWWRQDMKRPMNDRFNVSLQRQLPFKIRTDSTFFMNLGHNISTTDFGFAPTFWGTSGNATNVNMADAGLIHSLRGQAYARVANPFYNYLTPSEFPGSLRYSDTVSVAQLLRPMPQYGDLNEGFTPGFSNRYYALQLKAERNFDNGLAFTAGYNWNYEKSTWWFNDVDQYNDVKTWRPERTPTHSITGGGTWELPVGKGRKLLSNANPIVQAVLGGWSTSHIFSWTNGSLLRFRVQNDVTGNPKIDHPTLDHWFDTSVFQSPADPYAVRTNPFTYDGLRGPRNWNLDSTLVKFFPIKEQMRFELRIEAYNAFNHFIASDPISAFTSGAFGRSVGQANVGREMQYTARLHF